MASSGLTNGPEPYVTVTLRDIDFQDPVPERTLVLKAPHYQLKIGRGTASGLEGLLPAPNNAWFDSRVMSRSHAILRADPETKEILIEDVGSMHGTYLTGRRMKTGHVNQLYQKDTLIMGADVMRGDSEFDNETTTTGASSDNDEAQFNAMRLEVSWNWSEARLPSGPTHSGPTDMYRNTFTADYSEGYSSEEEGAHYDEPASASFIVGGQDDAHSQPLTKLNPTAESVGEDDEIQFVQDSVRQPSIEIVVPQPRAFTVPDTDDESNEDAGSDESGEVSAEEDSPISSPFVPDQPEHDAKKDAEGIPAVIDLGSPTFKATYTNVAQELASSSAHPLAVQDYSSEDNEEYSENDDYREDEVSLYGEPAIAEPPVAYTNTLPPPPATALRAPSPSDVAMPAKSPVSPVYNYFSRPGPSQSGPPFDRLPPPPEPYMPMYGPSTAVRPPGAWAGHNSTLYEPAQTYHSMSYAVPSMQYSGYGTSASYYPPSYTTPTSLAPLFLPSASLPDFRRYEAPAASSRPDYSTMLSDSDPSRKRKADKMDDYSPQAFDRGSSPLLGEELTTVAPKDVVINRAEVEQAFETVDSATAKQVEVEVPPRKKAKLTPGRSRVAKVAKVAAMAAGTAAVVAVGAVGGIVALATMPQQYWEMII